MVRVDLIERLKLILADEITHLLINYPGPMIYKEVNNLFPSLFLSYQIQAAIENVIIFNYINKKLQEHWIVFDYNREDLQRKNDYSVSIVLRTRFEIANFLGEHLSFNLNNNELEKLWFQLI